MESFAEHPSPQTQLALLPGDSALVNIVLLFPPAGPKEKAFVFVFSRPAGRSCGAAEETGAASSPESFPDGPAADSRSVSSKWERSLRTGPVAPDGRSRRC